MKRLRAAALALQSFVALSLLLGWQVAGAVTYDVRALHICANEEWCAEDDKILKRFQQINHRWAPLGITFRPTIERLYDATYAAISTWGDPGYDELLAMAQLTPGQITFFIIEGGNFKCWANLPQREAAGSVEAYALFCYTDIHGSAWAHELGHYFCLRHTHRFEDPATHDPVNHDGDGLAGTPLDPGKKEGTLIGDEPDSGPGHEWCDTTDIPQSFADVVFESTSQPGLAQARGCTVECVLSTGTADEPTPFAPLTENGMSYYDGCFGPWTYDGERHEYFEPDQGSRVAQCIAEEPERIALVDACAGDGDTDGDGLCDSEDACPLRPALVGMDVDTDGDGIVDGCDECNGFPGMGTDSDDDGFCDAVDVDDDNDSCKDDMDEHPQDGMIVVGHKVGDRRECSGPIYLWEGTPGPNGLKICHKTFTHDIDGDGIVNDSDYCPLEPGLGCVQPVSCPLPPPKWWLACALGGCNELELVVVEISNPGTVLARSKFQIANETLYARAAHGQTLLETARTFGGAAPPGAASTASAKSIATTKGSARRLRFEIRRDGSLVEVVAETDVRNIRVGPLVRGDVLALTTDRTGAGVRVDVTWGVGLAPKATLPDQDRDGIPDPHDNCTAIANLDQYDADDDGYGNRCDPDLDNDGRVTGVDAARMRAAIGGVGNTPFAGEDGERGDLFDLPRNVVDFVPEADIDGDGNVTDADQRLWAAARLGPSGLRR